MMTADLQTRIAPHAQHQCVKIIKVDKRIKLKSKQPKTRSGARGWPIFSTSRLPLLRPGHQHQHLFGDATCSAPVCLLLHDLLKASTKASEGEMSRVKKGCWASARCRTKIQKRGALKKIGINEGACSLKTAPSTQCAGHDGPWSPRRPFINQQLSPPAAARRGVHRRHHLRRASPEACARRCHSPSRPPAQGRHSLHARTAPAASIALRHRTKSGEQRGAGRPFGPHVRQWAPPPEHAERLPATNWTNKNKKGQLCFFDVFQDAFIVAIRCEAEWAVTAEWGDRGVHVSTA